MSPDEMEYFVFPCYDDKVIMSTWRSPEGGPLGRATVKMQTIKLHGEQSVAVDLLSFQLPSDELLDHNGSKEDELSFKPSVVPISGRSASDWQAAGIFMLPEVLPSPLLPLAWHAIKEDSEEMGSSEPKNSSSQLEEGLRVSIVPDIQQAQADKNK